MKIVLTQDVPGVGRAGEIKEVSDGHARNYLLPRRLAIPATDGQVRKAIAEKGVEVLKAKKAESAAKMLADSIAGLTLPFKVRVGEQHRLYGSITSQDIAEAISARIGHEIDKRKVEMHEPIRHLGTHTVPVRIAKDLVPAVIVVVEQQD